MNGYDRLIRKIRFQVLAGVILAFLVSGVCWWLVIKAVRILQAA